MLGYFFQNEVFGVQDDVKVSRKNQVVSGMGPNAGQHLAHGPSIRVSSQLPPLLCTWRQVPVKVQLPFTYARQH